MHEVFKVLKEIATELKMWRMTHQHQFNATQEILKLLRLPR